VPVYVRDPSGKKFAEFFFSKFSESVQDVWKQRRMSATSQGIEGETVTWVQCGIGMGVGVHERFIKHLRW
jgi:hypothetical protein